MAIENASSVSFAVILYVIFMYTIYLLLIILRDSL